MSSVSSLIRALRTIDREEVGVLVYCTNCGTNNEEEAKFCIGCGARLDETVGLGREIEETCLGPREKRHFEECFGLPHGGAIFGLVIGVLIILWGLIWVLQEARVILTTVELWPFAVIIFGVLMIAGAIYATSRRKG